MDEIQIQYSIIFPALASLILLWCIRRWNEKRNGIKNPPPSPPKLPIIGNLHQLGSFPHRNLQLLAKKHGPLMLLRLGRLPTLIVSTAEAAREIMKTHDLTFSDRPLYKAHKRVIYDGKGLIFGPYGDFWRQMKSVFVLKLLGNKRVQSSRRIMEEETSLFVKKVTSSPVSNLSEMFSEFSSDVVCRSAFGGKYSESENGKKFVKLVGELSEVMGAGVCVGDFVPWLSWIDRVSGFEGKVDRVARGLDDMLESVMEERLRNLKVQSDFQENFLDILLEIYVDETNDVPVEKDSIKALLLDVFAAGSDSTSITLEWAMAELLRHPKMMEKLQSEVRGIIQHKHDITDEDLEKMQYLKAVIKETFRLHPPVPLQLRIARGDVNIMGYDVVAGTIVMTNAWAIGRDPISWEEPEKFEPERFLNSSVDVKGQDFELIPFGAGRRGCPGIGFSMLLIELMIANLVEKFDWKLPDGTEGKELDMSECLGITVHRATPLLAVANQAT
ncbi:hypothetical protein C2S52_005234 [Perilla frutescens var. hirtella]|nr:hypothetical protein C2S52_005234 [Perilla frutescens var. hirtella]